MGSVAWAMAMIAICWCGLQGAEAQGTVDCLGDAGDGAPFYDANAMVQELRAPPSDTKCTSDSCLAYQIPPWNAAVTLCVPPDTCITSDDLGNYVNEILGLCLDKNNKVEGSYTLNQEQKFYLTSLNCAPYCINPN